MTSHLMPANGQEGPADGNQEQTAEHRDRHGFTQTAVGDENSKVQPRQDTDEHSGQEDATGPPVKLNMAGSNPRGKLQRCEQEKDPAWKNVRQCQERVSRKPAIDPSQLSWPLQRKRIVSMQSIHEPLPHGVGTREEIVSKDASADGRSDSDYYEHNHNSPQGTNQRARCLSTRGVVSLHSVRDRLPHNTDRRLGEGTADGIEGDRL
jgi:hypothetical protein